MTPPPYHLTTRCEYVYDKVTQYRYLREVLVNRYVVEQKARSLVPSSSSPTLMTYLTELHQSADYLPTTQLYILH